MFTTFNGSQLRSSVYKEGFRAGSCLPPPEDSWWEGLLAAHQSASHCGKDRDCYSKQRCSYQHWNYKLTTRFLKVEKIPGGAQHLLKPGGRRHLIAYS